MNQKPEYEAEKTLQMADVIQRVQPSEALMERLRSIPNTIREGYDNVPKTVVWAVAASIAALICINILSMKTYQSEQASNLKNVEATSYFSYLKSL